MDLGGPRGGLRHNGSLLPGTCVFPRPPSNFPPLQGEQTEAPTRWLTPHWALS